MEAVVNKREMLVAIQDHNLDKLRRMVNGSHSCDSCKYLTESIIKGRHFCKKHLISVPDPETKGCTDYVKM